jgi:hypothetical protein
VLLLDSEFRFAGQLHLTGALGLPEVRPAEPALFSCKGMRCLAVNWHLACQKGILSREISNFHAFVGEIGLTVWHLVCQIS